MSKKKNTRAKWVEGVRYERLVIIDRLPNRKAKCLCDCGNTTVVHITNLGRGNTKSCGCLFKERVKEMNKTHEMCGTRIYRIWANMKSRCYNEKFDSYKWYGDRGIKVCDEWHDFHSFYKSVGDPPTEMHTIDRINVNGDYSPDNFRWATMKEQCQNRRAKGSCFVKGEP